MADAAEPSPSLRKNFAWTLAGSLVFAAAQWATLIVLTKVASTEAAGDWTRGLALTGPIFVFSLLKLRVVQVTDVKNEYAWSDYFALRLIACAIAFLVVGAIAVIGYRDDGAWVIVMIALSKVFDSLSDMIYGQEQKRERMKAIGISQIVRSVTAVVASLAALWWSHSAAWAAAATAASYGVWLIWDWMRLERVLEGESALPRWHKTTLLALFRRVLPLGFVTAIGSLQFNIPRYFLDGYTSRTELGVFGTISALLMLGGIVVTTLAYVALPGMARHVAANEWKAFRRRVAQLMVLGFSLGLVGIAISHFAGREILRIIYSREVAEHDDVLFWLAVTSGLLWTYLFLGTALDAMRLFRIQPWIHLTSSAVIALASFILVPSYGMRGACWAMLVGYGSECLMYFIAVAIPLSKRKDGVA